MVPLSGILRFHQTWRAGKWTIEIADVPIETPNFVREFPSLPRLMTPVKHGVLEIHYS